MPKKFQGENSKAATARARKAEAKAVADARKKKEEDDALWQETDKHVLKKEQRKVSCPYIWVLKFLGPYSQPQLNMRIGFSCYTHSSLFILAIRRSLHNTLTM